MDGHETRRSFERQGSQEDGIDDGEDGRVGADAESQGEDGDGSEARVSAELAETVAAIGDHGGKPIASPLLANLLFHLFDAAKLDPRGALRFLRRHAGTNIFLGQHFEMGMNLLVEVCLHTPG